VTNLLCFTHTLVRCSGCHNDSVRLHSFIAVHISEIFQFDYSAWDETND